MLARSFLSPISQDAAAPVDASRPSLPHHRHRHLHHRQPRLGPVRESRGAPLAAQPQSYMSASSRVAVLARHHWVPATTREYLGKSTKQRTLGPGTVKALQIAGNCRYSSWLPSSRPPSTGLDRQISLCQAPGPLVSSTSPYICHSSSGQPIVVISRPHSQHLLHHDHEASKATCRLDTASSRDRPLFEWSASLHQARN